MQTNKNLIPVDFSKGIRADVINKNLEILEDMLQRERLSVAGHGISSGLNLTINDFSITVSEGALIDVQGKELFLPECKLNLPLPELTEVKEELHTVEEEGIIVLSHIPYDQNKQHVVQPGSNNSGLVITEYGKDTPLKLISINDNVLSIGAANRGKLVKVSYYYTNKRYDTLYIDTDNKIKYLVGTTSYSPSFPIPNEYAYLIAFIEVDPYGIHDILSKKAILRIKDDLRGRRNLYTDENNRLYICGIPFDDLQIIHMTLPLNPFENQLWYDIEYNKLKVWKTIDGIGAWINVNDTSIIPVLEVKAWDMLEHDDSEERRVFLFHNQEDHHMKFIPGKKELAVYIDQGVLHMDQYREITLTDILADKELKKLLIEKYGYTEEDITNADVTSENWGVGFCLDRPLSKESYVEARVTHRVHENPLATRFQRSATFVSEGHQAVRESGVAFETNQPYRCGENQLEVFIDGRKLIRGIDFTEGADIQENGKPVAPEDIVKGTVSYAYKILRSIPSNSIVHYKITSTIYSYDHIEKMVGGLDSRVDEIVQTTEQTLETINQTKAEVERSIGTMQSEVNAVKESLGQLDNFFSKEETIPYNNMPQEVKGGVVKGIINKHVVKQSDILTLTDISDKDYITVYDVSNSIPKLIMRNMNEDAFGVYKLLTDSNGQTQMLFTPDAVNNGTTLYITGFKL